MEKEEIEIVRLDPSSFLGVLVLGLLFVLLLHLRWTGTTAELLVVAVIGFLTGDRTILTDIEKVKGKYQVVIRVR